jgi:pSer/pThr/pTyr-binding forkhead associated (FHA) protein
LPEDNSFERSTPLSPTANARGLIAVNHHSLELFLAACGSDGPLRLSVGERDQLASKTWTFQQPFLVIGRRPDSDLMLDHWQVSRRHAYLQFIEGRIFCVDLGSRTGTHGGDVTERSGWLERNRAVQIGPFTVKPEWPTMNARPSVSRPGVTWELPGRAIGQAVWRMDRQLVMIGRSPACKIRIVEPDVSKFHCSLVLTAHGLWVIDLLGQNGVFVNDKPVRCVRLDDGDELRIGRHLLRPRYDSPPLPLPQDRQEVVDPSTNQGSTSTVMPFSFQPPTIGSNLATRMMPPMPPVGQNLPMILEKSGGVVDPSVNLLVHQFGMMQQQMLDQFHQTMMMMFEGFAALHREQAGTIREEFEHVRKLSVEIEALRAETAKLAEAAAARPAERTRPASYDPSTQIPGRSQFQGEPIKKAAPPLPDPDVDIHAKLCLRLASIESERQNRWQKILGMMTSKS